MSEQKLRRQILILRIFTIIAVIGFVIVTIMYNSYYESIDMTNTANWPIVYERQEFFAGFKFIFIVVFAVSVRLVPVYKQKYDREKLENKISELEAEVRELKR